jgi:hypothetical protein
MFYLLAGLPAMLHRLAGVRLSTMLHLMAEAPFPTVYDLVEGP